MGTDVSSLRGLQSRHALILLHGDEFAGFEKTGKLPLPQRHSEHFGRVLRRREAWPALVGDGAGRILPGNVEQGMIVRAEGGEHRAQPGKAPVTLVQAWVKQKALAIILQKAAELGATAIILVDSEFSAPHSEKAARMETILENACMQAYNPVKPLLQSLPSMAEIDFGSGSVFFGDTAAEAWLAQIPLGAGAPLFFCNGPEGGFSPREIADLRSRATGVLLSENVLRSETAAITALSYLRMRA